MLLVSISARNPAKTGRIVQNGGQFLLSSAARVELKSVSSLQVRCVAKHFCAKFQGCCSRSVFSQSRSGCSAGSVQLDGSWSSEVSQQHETQLPSSCMQRLLLVERWTQWPLCVSIRQQPRSSRNTDEVVPVTTNFHECRQRHPAHSQSTSRDM